MIVHMDYWFAKIQHICIFTNIKQKFFLSFTSQYSPLLLMLKVVQLAVKSWEMQTKAGAVSERKVKTHISTFLHPYLNLKDYGVQKREGWGVWAATSAFRESEHGQMATKSRSRMIE